MRGQGRCVLCSDVSLLSSYLGVCLRCVRERPEEATAIASRRHATARQALGLPPQLPRSSGGLPCRLCAAECIMAAGERGYCGVRGNNDGRIYSLARKGAGLLNYYLDLHVTNCCNTYFCPAGTGCGYPRYAYREGPEAGYYNLALFFYGCGLNCLFCQNWGHKIISEAKEVEAQELVDVTLSNPKISCWCWFGGSAEPQLPFAIEASRMIHESKPSGRIVRICYEWNGDGHPSLVARALETVVESGGNVKFDIKAHDPNLHAALTGLDNRRILENFGTVNFYLSFAL